MTYVVAALISIMQFALPAGRLPPLVTMGRGWRLQSSPVTLRSGPHCAQLARSAPELPDGDGWLFERKWDGFRTIVFVDGDEVFLQSRNGRPTEPLLPRAELPAGPLRARRRAGDPRHRRRGAVRRRSRSGSTRPTRGCRCWPKETPAPLRRLRPARKRRPRACSSTPFAERRKRLEAMRRRAAIELAPPPPTAPPPRAGCQTAEGVIAKRPTRRTCRESARACSRSSGCGRSTRGRRLAAGQGEGHGRLADPRPLRPRRASRPWSATPRRSRPPSGRASWWTSWRPTSGRARHRRSQPLERRPRPGVALASARAGRRGQLRPPQRPPDPPWRKAPYASATTVTRKLRDLPARQLTAAFPG